MKIKVDEKDIVKHWGIWLVNANTWFCDDSGIIFAALCPRVANVQVSLLIGGWGNSEADFDVREIK